MFIVYSPEGQSQIAASQLRPDLTRIEPTAQVPNVSESPMDETNMSPEQAEKNKKIHSAIHQYQTVKEGLRHLVVYIGEIMSSPVLTVPDSATLLDAWELMSDQAVHHLPVVNYAQTLVGIISYHEILQRAIISGEGELEEIRQESVAQWMHQQVITTLAKTDIRKVASVMSEYKVGSMVVLNDDKQIIGIVTLSDLVKRLAEEPPLTLYV